MISLIALVVAPRTWTLICGGDVMMNSISARNKPLAAIAKHVRAADLAYANLEVPLTTSTGKTPRKTAEQIARKSQFVLKAEPAHAQHLADVGFDIVSLGNNHSMDFGPAGLREMTAALDRAKIDYAGAGENLSAATRPAVRKVGDLRVGMISFMSFVDDSSNWATWPATKTSPGLAALAFQGKMDTARQAQVKTIVREAKQSCDFLIVAMHWGVERTTVPTRYQVSLGRAFIDSGADVVAGAHPHRLQGAEIYKGKPILYSMGNLISPLPGETGLMRLRFDGANYRGADFIPLRIAGRKVEPYSGAAHSAQVAKFEKLCTAVEKGFPNQRATSIYSAGRR
ncbi:MAG TPA: CapA family protein [Fimbriimonadaceae bacterium]|nr:CapA family protein [Fimbriimonadaceae bacterium]HRJ95566.1 CapA family protein [Fimbriimonadaceae bacterium]